MFVQSQTCEGERVLYSCSFRNCTSHVKWDPYLSCIKQRQDTKGNRTHSSLFSIIPLTTMSTTKLNVVDPVGRWALKRNLCSSWALEDEELFTITSTVGGIRLLQLNTCIVSKHFFFNFDVLNNLNKGLVFSRWKRGN